jgi:predicted DNA-binding transcriptional regulator AlpA
MMRESESGAAQALPMRTVSARTQSGRQLGLKVGQGVTAVQTVARFLDVTHRSLYKLVAVQGMPPPTSPGRSKRWIVEEILAWVPSASGRL